MIGEKGIASQKSNLASGSQTLLSAGGGEGGNRHLLRRLVRYLSQKLR